MNSFVIVCATRFDRVDFFNKSQLGKSINMYNLPFVHLELIENNSQSLSVVYNQAIEKYLDSESILVFIHDDVTLCDYYWQEHISNSLNIFDMVGVAGNIQRNGMQPSWFYIDQNLNIDKAENLSGRVGHGKKFPPDIVSYFGPVNKKVKIIDGVLIALKTRTLKYNKIRFDPLFRFHFYDIDFCRQAEFYNLSVGTCPVSIIHGSVGDFKNPAWNIEYENYIKKWNSND